MRRSMLATRGRAAPAPRLPAGMRAQRPHGVRWGTAGRAAGVAALLGLAVAWPRLSPATPSLPSDRAMPVVSGGGHVAAGRASGPAERRRRAERTRRPERTRR